MVVTGSPATAARAAERAGLIEIRGHEVFFTHPLYAAAAYDGLLTTERMELHSRLAAVVEGEEVYWGIKQRAIASAKLRDEPAYTEIEMPRNSPTGFICAFFATFMGFALIWHIWWLVGAAVLGAFVTFVVFAWRDEDEYVIPADEVARIDRANRRARSEAIARLRVAR